jgi:16S rRNA (adenine1518-N6/adenine1519-N6)-dimethyltransferase
MAVRKRFGQHFLHDPAVIRRIVDTVAPRRGERLVEVGPGRGALTWSLLDRTKDLDVIEIDRDLARALQAQASADMRLRIHVENVLDTNFVRLRAGGPPLRIVGNLPYNISTPLLFHLLSQRAAVADMHFMLQKEVVDRMAALPGGKQYGRLTVMLAAYAVVEGLFDVGPGAFQPQPKVWSALVRLTPSPEPRFAIGSDSALRALVTAAFSHRRKTLRNGLLGLLSAEDIRSCEIDPQSRPETLAPAQFGRLAVQYCRLRGDETKRLSPRALRYT